MTDDILQIDFGSGTIEANRIASGVFNSRVKNTFLLRFFGMLKHMSIIDSRLMLRDAMESRLQLRQIGPAFVISVGSEDLAAHQSPWRPPPSE